MKPHTNLEGHVTSYTVRCDYEMIWNTSITHSVRCDDLEYFNHTPYDDLEYFKSLILPMSKVGSYY